MTQEALAPVQTSSNKKQRRKEIVEKLTGALSEYKQDLGEKKLAIRVKKVSKLLSRDLERSIKKHQSDLKKDEARKTPNTKKEKSARNKAPKKTSKKSPVKA